MYKFVGNRILTRFQNATSGMALSEWHSGYRAYRVDALGDVPFTANSDGFDFDTEIILQLNSAGKRIAEVPIPTYYGDEICYVNGVRYARDVVRHSVRHRLGASGFGAGELARVDEPYAFKPSPHSSHGRVLAMLDGSPPLRILDVGCGPGHLAGALTSLGHDVTGVDALAADGVESRMKRFVRADLDTGLPDDVGDRLRRDHRRRRARTRPPTGPAPRPDRRPAPPGWSGHRQRAEHQPLVPTRSSRGRAVRLRPARHPRRHSRALLHPPVVPPPRPPRRTRTGAGEPHRAAVRRARPGRRPWCRGRRRRGRPHAASAPGRRCSPTSSCSNWCPAGTARRADVVAPPRRRRRPDGP